MSGGRVGSRDGGAEERLGGRMLRTFAGGIVTRLEAAAPGGGIDADVTMSMVGIGSI